MSRQPFVRSLVVALLFSGLLALGTSSPAGADTPAATLVGLTDGNVLLRFSELAPGTILDATAISGLQPGEKIVGIDIRPATGQLYGIGLTGTNGRVYTIDPTTGAATQVGAATFSTTLTAVEYGVDFNPTVDRIRVVNSDEENLRVNPMTGVRSDSPANDADLNPGTPNIGAAAYDRIGVTQTQTTLYAISDSGDSLVTIGSVNGTPTSPNIGLVATVGPLGVAVSGGMGLDVSEQGTAYASLLVGGSTGLYTINLSTGAASLVGAIGSGATALTDLAVTPTIAAGATQFTPLTPQRILDTRSAIGAAAGKVAAGGTLELQVAGQGGVPATGATAVVLNVTATEAINPGFITAYPSGEARPTASNLNTIATGQTIANLVTVKLGANGKVSLFTEAGTHLIADVAGYYAPPTSAAGRYVPLTPARILDTRPGAKPAAGSTTDVQVTNVQGVPATGVSAVVLNVTLTQTTLGGYVTTWPTGLTRPDTSSLNAERPDQSIANLVIVPVGAGGKVSLFTENGTHLLADVAGYFTDSSIKGAYKGLFVPQSPDRFLDTRSGARPGAGTTTDLGIAGARGVPATAIAAALNVTLADTTNPGYVTVFPKAATRPEVSNINADRANQVIPNSVVATMGTGGAISLFTEAGTHFIVDVSGYYTG